MQEIKVNLSERSYRIIVGKGILGNLSDFIGSPSRVLLITDTTLYALYGKRLESVLREKFPAENFLLPPGEKGKNIKWALGILRKAILSAFDRYSLFLCLGGGSVGDTGGFAASIYMRGVRCIQVPTTFLAMVDSSIGGKTAVDFYGKNIVGTFYQPSLVISDTATLKTLPERNYLNGFAEVVKYGVIKEPAILALLREKREEILQQGEVLESLISQCAQIKAKVIEEDEKEKGLRMILNFGHTIGHALEANSKFALWHGEAISLGIVASAYISHVMGMIKKEVLAELEDLLSLYSLPTRYGRFSPHRLKEFLQRDKKVKRGKLRFVLMKNPGEVEIRDDVPESLLEESLEYLKQDGRNRRAF